MNLCQNCHSNPVHKHLMIATYVEADMRLPGQPPGAKTLVPEEATPIPLCLECGRRVFKAIQAALPGCSNPDEGPAVTSFQTGRKWVKA